MSHLSGKCDLYDHIYMIHNDGNYTKQQCFDKFKVETGGVIYQNIPIEVTKYNLNMVLENNSFLTTCEEGGYEYFGRKYKTLKSLNKEHITYKRKITFNTMEDLIPYLACIISIGSFTGGSQYIEISSEPYPIRMYKEFLMYGRDDEDIINRYYNELKKEYIDV